MEGKSVKCIILDLDNTIWGGVVGDDGTDGIKIGNYSNGRAFSDFQFWLKSLKERGIILSICSKNEESIAKDPFLNHPEMILTLDDISVFVANWKNKVDNIKYIQSVLNIGFDTIVFLDDNPAERDLVRSGIKDIIVPNLPTDPSHYRSYLIEQNLFETGNYSNLDKDRTKFYKQEENRKKALIGSYDIKTYLKSLSMQSSVHQFSSKNLTRITQLFQRTNQFNATLIRYSETKIEQILHDDNYFTLASSLDDKFGSNGIVFGMVIKKINKENAFIESMVMSCRVFKRGLEFFIFDTLKKYLIEKKFKNLSVQWVPTDRNKLVKTFYSDLGYKKFENQLSTMSITDIKLKEFFIQPKKGGLYE